MSRLTELLAQRAKTHADMVVLLNGPQTPDARNKTNAMLADIESLTGDIERIQRADIVTAQIEGRAAVPAGGSVVRGAVASKAQEYRAAFMDYLKNGEPGMRSAGNGGQGASPESLQLLREARKRIVDAKPEQRDQLAGTQSIVYTLGTQGGYFVPAGFVHDIDQATKYYADLLNTVRVITTKTGAVLPYPTSNDTDQAWHILGEGTEIQDQATNANYPTPGVLPTQDAGNVALGHVNFSAYKGSTGLIRVSLELLQDSDFDFEAFLAEQFATRLGRGYEAYFTNGNGSDMPTGILPAIAASGAVSVTASGSNAEDGSGSTGTNSIGYQDIINLIHGVDPTYRKKARFMFHDLTLAHLKTRLDKYGRPFWIPAAQVGQIDTLAGYPYVINQSFPQIAASATTIAFGDWSKFIVRKVKDLQVLRLDERFADFGEVAFVGFSRVDSNLVDAGTHPITTLVQHS